MSNELTTKNTDVATWDDGEVFGTEGIDNTDLMLPRLLLMQKMSKLLEDSAVTAQAGDVLDSLTKQVVASGKPAEIIPLFSKKFWRETWTKEKEERTQKLPFDGSNADWKYEEVIDDWHVKRNQAIEWYCIQPSQVKEGTALPCVVSFQKTSMPAGRKLNTLVKQASMLRLPACARAYELYTVKASNEHGTYYIFDIGKYRPVNAVEKETATLWYKTLQTTSHKVDEGEVTSQEAGAEIPF